MPVLLLPPTVCPVLHVTAPACSYPLPHPLSHHPPTHLFPPSLARCSQPKWTGIKPEPVDWEARLAEVLERGKAVPEVLWCKPGEDAAMEVSRRA